MAKPLPLLDDLAGWGSTNPLGKTSHLFVLGTVSSVCNHATGPRNPTDLDPDIHASGEDHCRLCMAIRANVVAAAGGTQVTNSCVFVDNCPKCEAEFPLNNEGHWTLTYRHSTAWPFDQYVCPSCGHCFDLRDRSIRRNPEPFADKRTRIGQIQRRLHDASPDWTVYWDTDDEDSYHCGCKLELQQGYCDCPAKPVGLIAEPRPGAENEGLTEFAEMTDGDFRLLGHVQGDLRWALEQIAELTEHLND